MLDGLAQARRRARAWAHVALSASMARLQPDRVLPPRVAHLLVTYRCNLRCVTCGSWRVRDHDDLTLAEWRDVLRQLRSLDVAKVLGGEPFVRSDLADLLVAIREIVDPYVLQLTTNGMMTKRVVEAVHRVGWPGLQLRISVDGTEATHDRSRGVPGSWRKVDRTVREVAALQGRYGFKLGINFAVTDDTLQDVEAMVRYAEEVGADLIPGVCTDPFLVGTTPPEQRRQEIVAISDKERALAILEDARMGTRRELPLVDHVVSRWFSKRTYEHQLRRGATRFPCRELRDLLYLLPNGDVVRCGLDHRPVGNLRRQRFDEIWYGEAIRAFRQRVDDCPGCMQSSIQILSRIYGGCLDA